MRQPQLLAESLQALEPQRPGIVDLYFVGFAPYASQDVFRKDVDTARTAVSERFDAAKRSVELVSNPRTVLETPIASGSNLRATLKAVGERIDRDEDVVMLLPHEPRQQGSSAVGGVLSVATRLVERRRPASRCSTRRASAGGSS